MYAAAAAAAKSLQSCLTLRNPIDGSPPGSTVPGILQARTLEWVAISFSNAWNWKVKAKSLSHVRLFTTPMDHSLPSSSIHGIFQARVLEWVAIAFSYWAVNTSVTLKHIEFSVQTLRCPTLCNPWTAAQQSSLSITNSWGLLKLMSIDWVLILQVETAISG